MTIVLRSVKGTPLTSNEVDGNFTDLDGRLSTAQTTANNAQPKVAGKGLSTNDYDNAEKAKVAAAVPSTQKGVANGVATLGADGKLPVSQLPPLAVNEVFTVASQAAMLALTAERGDMAIRTDQAGQAYILAADAPTVLANWVQIKQNLAVALVALGAITPAVDTLAYFNGTATAASTAFTSTARALLGGADSAAMRTTLLAAMRGTNNDITSLAGLTTALSVAQGGTGTNAPNALWSALLSGTQLTMAQTALERRRSRFYDPYAFCVDIDDVTATQILGWAYVNAATTGTKPATNGIVYTVISPNDAAVQEFIPITGSQSVTQTAYRRTAYGTTATRWGPWLPIVTGELISTPTDVTVGRIVTAGWMGYGGILRTIATLDFNALPTQSSKFIGQTTANGPESGDFYVDLEYYDTNNANLTATHIGSGRRYSRTKTGPWGLWGLLHTTANSQLDPALGTGGLMSSTVISGWTVSKYANGEIILVSPFDYLTSFAANELRVVDVNIPVTILSFKPSIAITVVTPASVYDCTVPSSWMPGPTSVRFAVKNGGTAQTFNRSIMVKGMWK